MSIYRIADLNIKINNKYRYTSELCKNYLAENQNITPDFEVSPTREDYEKDKEFLKDYSDGYLEGISIYRQIARKLPDYDAMVMHACVVEMDGRGYGFSAPSGTGKSTHARLWLSAFEDRAKIVNGDKPIIRIIDGKLFAYGTPWCGKEGYNLNTKVPLECICFLSQAKNNEIKSIDAKTALSKIFTQLLIPETNEQTDSFFKMLDFIFENVNFFSLGCNMNKEAAYVAYEGMNER